MSTTVRWISHNKLLTTGGFIIGVLLLISLIGPHIIDEQDIKIGYAPPDQPPSWEYPLGTDTSGRQMLPTILYGTPLTLRVGIIAGALGTAIGVILAFVSGFYRGLPDAIIRSASDTLLTVPVLLLLVVVASTLSGALTVNQEALLLAALTWMGPTRIIRSQVLSMRERAYVDVARASGANGFQIIFLELVPNLLPYIAVSFVGAVAQAILRLHRHRGPRSRASEREHPGDDHLLVSLQQFLRERSVVVVCASDSHHRAPVHRPVPHVGRPRQDRQPQTSEIRIGATATGDGLSAARNHSHRSHWTNTNIDEPSDHRSAGRRCGRK